MPSCSSQVICLLIVNEKGGNKYIPSCDFLWNIAENTKTKFYLSYTDDSIVFLSLVSGFLSFFFFNGQAVTLTSG